MSKIVLLNEASTPAKPSTGKVSVYTKSGKLHYVGDDGNEVALLANVPAPGTSGNVLTSDGTDWTSAALPVRERLTAARTYYVRTDGSDSNNGLTNTSGGAFLTLQKAVNVSSGLETSTTASITIQLADGTYNGDITLKNCTGNGTITIQGNTSNKDAVTIGGGFLKNTAGTSYTLRWLKLVKSSTFTSAIQVSSFGIVYVDNLNFSTGWTFHMTADRQGGIESTLGYTVSAGCLQHLRAASGGMIFIVGCTVTVTGTPNFTGVFCLAEYAGVYIYGVTFSGSATGSRYSAYLNGIIFTNGGGATYLPGNAVGTLLTGGQYA